jgi:hypothetical protein
MSSFIIFCTFLVLLQFCKRTRNKAFSEPRNTFLRCVSAKPYQNVWARTYGYFYGRLCTHSRSPLPAADWSQLLCDNFGNFLRRLPFALASTFLYGYNPHLTPTSWSVSFLPREEEVDNILNVLECENLFGFNLLTPGPGVWGLRAPILYAHMLNFKTSIID